MSKHFLSPSLCIIYVSTESCFLREPSLISHHVTQRHPHSLAYFTLFYFPHSLPLFERLLCTSSLVYCPSQESLWPTAFFFFNLFNLFNFWLHWVFLAARGLSLVAMSGGYSSLRCAGFLLQWLLLLRSAGSRHTGFSSCGTWASVVAAHGLQ